MYRAAPDIMNPSIHARSPGGVPGRIANSTQSGWKGFHDTYTHTQ